jgi:hypothetical protein
MSDSTDNSFVTDVVYTVAVIATAYVASAVIAKGVKVGLALKNRKNDKVKP